MPKTALLRAVAQWDSKSLAWIAFVSAIAFCVAQSSGGIQTYLYTLGSNEFNADRFNGITAERLVAIITAFILCGTYVIWLLRCHGFSLPSHEFSKDLSKDLSSELSKDLSSELSKDLSNDLSNESFSGLSGKRVQMGVPTRIPAMFKVVLPFLAIAFITYPLSTDVYMYLKYGWMAINGTNPYLVGPLNFPSPLMPLIYWYQTSTYGPGSLLVFMASAIAVPVNILFSVYLFKVFCLLFHMANAALIWRLLTPFQNRNLIAMAYLINPVLLIAHVADAHLDVFLATTTILLIGCLYYRKFVGAVLAVVGGILTKTLPVVWLPLVLAFLVRQQRWKALAIATLISAGIVLLLSLTLLPGLDAWTGLVNPGVSGLTARSIHHFINLLLVYTTDLTEMAWESLTQRTTQISYFGFIGFYAWMMLRPFLKSNYSEMNLVVDLGWVTVALFMFATPWLMPWYPSLLLAIAFMSFNAPGLLLTSLTFGICSTIIAGPASGKTFVSLFASLLTLGPAMLTILFRNQLASWVPPLLQPMRSHPSPKLLPVEKSELKELI
ncbi:MAG: hypothetical protein MUF49_22530 [Oculatellaceae cyanobacterium Prado106]|jgi:alpha-1,6-mannosyltransferase|nr:hypothetical protein [Oculatellaceae cyanobacterium Prado106]